MPGTVNGIGTTYRGKKNLGRRTGVCEKCHRQVELESYETRLYWVFVFLPVIPLERKQIVDYCPICTAHRAIPLHQWQAVTREAIDEAARAAAEKPDDVDAALELHGTLVSFGRHEEAARVADTLARNFPDNLEVQIHLGSWHAQSGREHEADACFDKALSLDPHDLAARRAVGVGCIERGDLARARELLAFMEKKCPEQDPGVLVLLADAFGARGDHQQAMELYEVVLRAFPGLGGDRRLRKRIAKSEAALGRGESILPKLPLYRRPAFLAAALAVVAVAGVMLYHHFLGAKPLVVVNGLAVPVDVTFDESDGPYTVAAGSRQTVRLGLGSHQAVVARPDAGDETVDFDMQAGFFERFSSKKIFVLNVAGAADFLWEKSIYTKGPAADAPPIYRIHYGQKFLVFDDVDYSFDEQFPAKVEGPEHSTRLAKTRVSILQAPPAAVLTLFPDGTPPQELLKFAEHHLAINPAEEMLVQFYAAISSGVGQEAPCRDFLQTRLDYRPVAVEWHRMYQELCKTTGSDEGLPAAYDRMLQDAPNDSALLYLRGRIEPDGAAASRYFDRSIAADPSNPYPRLAKAYQLASRGDFAAARGPAAEACRLKPGSISMTQVFAEIRLALGEYEALEAELRAQQQEAPTGLALQEDLLVVLAAAGKLDEAGQAHRAYAQSVAKQVAQSGMRQDPKQRGILSEMTLAYLRDDMAGYLRNAKKLTDATASATTACAAHLELDRPAEAEEAFAQVPKAHKPLYALLLSLAWKQQGDQAKADRWRQAAIEQFRAGSADHRHLAALLAKGDDLQPAEIDNVDIQRRLKAAALVALADRSPSHRTQLLRKAAKLNLVGLFPHRFLKRTIAAMKE